MTEKGQYFHPLRREYAGPLFVADGTMAKNDLCNYQQGKECHQHGGYPLCEPVAYAVVGADDNAFCSRN